MTTSPWDIGHTHWCCSLVGNSQPAQAGPRRLGRPGPRLPPLLLLSLVAGLNAFTVSSASSWMSLCTSATLQSYVEVWWKQFSTSQNYIGRKKVVQKGYDTTHLIEIFSFHCTVYSPGLILLLLWLPARKRWREVTNANEKYETYRQSQEKHNILTQLNSI